MNATDPLAGWIPFALTARGGQAGVEWGYMGQERFSDPFFDMTVQRLLRRPFNHVFRRHSGFDSLLARAETHPGLAPSGLIFHMSRCGSTLISQGLAALADSVVLSEPEPLNTLLQWLITLPTADRAIGINALRALLSALGQPRRAEDRRLFVKTSCWHISHADWLLSAFPGIPWVFVYRDPLEVLVSQRRSFVPDLLPGNLPHLLAEASSATLQDPIEYAAWMMARMMTAAASAMGRYPGGMLLHYRELPTALEDRLAGHFGLNLNPADLAALRLVATRNAKHPERPFRADSAEKQAEACDALQDIAARWLAEPYAELEQPLGRMPDRAIRQPTAEPE